MKALLIIWVFAVAALAALAGDLVSPRCKPDGVAWRTSFMLVAGCQH